MKISEKEFCEMVTGWDGEHVDKIKQIELISFNGEDLKDFIEHCIKFKNNGDLGDVSQQRELLLAFIKFYHSDAHSPENTSFNEDVDAFLKAKNCD